MPDRSDPPHRRGTIARNLALAVPLVLVNTVAVYGQSAWAHQHIAHSWPIAVGFAATIESIGVYLAAEAHAALMADQAALKLRLGSYAIGALAGALNYAHFAPTWRPSPTAVAFAAMSAISPWLWGIRSRAMQRTRLLAAGLVDRRSVRFSLAQWVVYPVRSTRAWRRAVWVGEQDPAAARLLVDRPAWQPAPAVTEPAPEPTTDPLMIDAAGEGDDQQKQALPPAERVRRWARRNPAVTAREIHERTGIPLSTVRTHLRAARTPGEAVNGHRVPGLVSADGGEPDA